MNILEFISRLENIEEEVNRIVADNQDEILQLRKDELLLGRNSDGKPFTPGYTNDPYFKTPKAAQGYANYKQKIEGIHKARIVHLLPYPNKGSNTPNMRRTTDKYNSRSYHDTLAISVSGGNIEIISHFKDAAKVDAKYQNKVRPLAPYAKIWFWNERMWEKLYEYLTR